MIFVYVDKVSILTLISRRTDQEIRNSKAQEITKPFIVKTDYKNLTGFLTIKELNRRQV